MSEQEITSGCGGGRWSAQEWDWCEAELERALKSCEQHLWEIKEEFQSQVKAASPAEVVSILVVGSIRREVRLKEGSGKLGSWQRMFWQVWEKKGKDER